MKKAIFSLAIASIALVSCQKENGATNDFSREIS
ncbi:MAG: hypothetical protein ACI8XB_001737, partial [Patiriisocius sp.]